MVNFSKKGFFRNYQSEIQIENKNQIFISYNSIIKDADKIVNDLEGNIKIDEKNVLLSLDLFHEKTTNSYDLVSTTNKLNDSFEEYLDLYGTKKLLALLIDDDFEPGYKSRAYDLVEKYLLQNSQVTRNWINKIFLDNSDKSHILLGILNLLKEFDYNLVYPQGQTIAISCFSHKDIMLKEMAVRCFEKWEDLNSINVLKNYEINVDWIEEYLNQVIEDLSK